MPGSLSGVLMSCAIYFHRRNVFMHHPLNWIPWKSSFNGQLGVPQSWAYIGISHREPMLGSGYIQTWNTAHVNSNKISKSSTCTHYPTQYVIVHVLSNTHTYIYQICIYRYKKHQICLKKKASLSTSVTGPSIQSFPSQRDWCCNALLLPPSPMRPQVITEPSERSAAKAWSEDWSWFTSNDDPEKMTGELEPVF